MAQTLNASQLQQALRARVGAASRPGLSPGAVGESIERNLQKYVNAEPFVQFDTQFFAAAAAALGNVLTLATFPASGELPFFSNRTLSNSSQVFTSVTDTNKFDTDFECHCISVDVYMNGDVASAAGVSNAQAFVEEIVNYGVLQVKFGTDVKIILPVIKAPSGGGIVVAAKVRTQGAAADSDSVVATNGLQDTNARRVLPEPIMFKKNEQFSLSIAVNAASRARIAALTALAGNNQAAIRVNLEGLRGKPFLRGTKIG